MPLKRTRRLLKEEHPALEGIGGKKIAKERSQQKTAVTRGKVKAAGGDRDH